MNNNTTIEKFIKVLSPTLEINHGDDTFLFTLCNIEFVSHRLHILYYHEHNDISPLLVDYIEAYVTQTVNHYLTTYCGLSLISRVIIFKKDREPIYNIWTEEKNVQSNTR
jgi:hypothetical protein